jgi:hypothetical protein
LQQVARIRGPTKPVVSARACDRDFALARRVARELRRLPRELEHALEPFELARLLRDLVEQRAAQYVDGEALVGGRFDLRDLLAQAGLALVERRTLCRERAAQRRKDAEPSDD